MIWYYERPGYEVCGIDYQHRKEIEAQVFAEITIDEAMISEF